MKDCPISLEAFLNHANNVLLVIDDKPIELKPKEFSTGSFGWNGSSRLTIPVGDIPLTLQLSTNATVLKSKDAPRKGELKEISSNYITLLLKKVTITN